MPGAHAATEARLAEVVAGAPGRLSAAVTCDDGWSWCHDADLVMVSASTIKVPILLAALGLVQQGRLHLDDSVSLPTPPSRVGGYGPLSLLRSVTELPLVEVLTLMVALSDNVATNAVIDLVGRTAVGDLLAKVPTAHTCLRRRMMDFAATERGLQNETSAADMAAVLVALREGRLLDADHSAFAFEILRTQQFRDGLPAYLPEDVVVASKTGELPGMRGDVALLERGSRWVVVAVLADGLAENGVDRGTAVLPVFAQIGEAACELL